MIITKKWLNSHKTSKGGYTKRQLAILGINWPPSKGWQDKLVGTEINNQLAKEFENAVQVRCRSKRKKS